MSLRRKFTLGAPAFLTWNPGMFQGPKGTHPGLARGQSWLASAFPLAGTDLLLV